MNNRSLRSFAHLKYLKSEITLSLKSLAMMESLIMRVISGSIGTFDLARAPPKVSLDGIDTPNVDENEDSGREPLSISISDKTDNLNDTLIPDENIFASDSQPTGIEFFNEVQSIFTTKFYSN